MTSHAEGLNTVLQGLHLSCSSSSVVASTTDTSSIFFRMKKRCVLAATVFGLSTSNVESYLTGALQGHRCGRNGRSFHRTSQRTLLFDSPPFDESGEQFPWFMNGLSISGQNSTFLSETAAYLSFPGVPSLANKGIPMVRELPVTNGVEAPRGDISREAPTAPEVNSWTTIMGGDFLQKEQRETVDQIYQDLRDMSAYDCEQVEEYWNSLLPAASYLGTERVTKIYDALRVAYRAHRGQMRKSGEPFIIHPVEVSVLLAGLKMDAETVTAGLLHDTVEDTDLTFELVEEMFGPVVRSIVEGETKVSKLPKLAFSEYADEQAENLRQMFVAMTDDYRIIIVKLADRLHNMRTLRHMKPEKQIKISRETLDIFAPLAHRMGIWQFKSELEDTAFMYLYPQEYKRLNRRLRQHQKKFQDTLDRSQKMLRDRLSSDRTLRDQAVEVSVSGRMKEIYSLWHKMETKGDRNIDHIVDVVALRVVITPKQSPDDEENASDRGVWLCYHVLGLVQHLDGFQPVPTRVKDYISFPKPNGYQSLHTALILNGQKIEVQIRTSMMHQVAEYGMASHWAYKDNVQRQNGNADLYNTPWLSSIKEWQNEKLNARDFVDSVRSELLGKRVFVFLRNGKILNLARGTTAVDAAFQIHTEVGLTMHGVEINGKPVPISYELQNGDVVSILTGQGKPSTEWMRYAKSRSTRSKLRSYFRAKQKER
jgi:RelA/SpoT family (p)ppGpp synthetase